MSQCPLRHSGADWLFIGDSSCLMGFSGKRLEDTAGGNHRVINLGTLSYLGLNGYAALLSRYAAANPGSLRTVVVLVHPEMLRGIAPVPEYLRDIRPADGDDESGLHAGADLLSIARNQQCCL